MIKGIVAGLSVALALSLAAPASAWVKFSGVTGSELGLDESLIPFGTQINVRFFPDYDSLDIDFGAQTFSAQYVQVETFDNLNGVDRYLVHSESAYIYPDLTPTFALVLQIDYADTTWSGAPPFDLLTNFVPQTSYVSVARTGVSGASGGVVTQGFLPEPGTWTTAVLGFSAIGAMLRRSRRSRRLCAA